MPTGTKFNNPTGTTDQIQCQDICGIEDFVEGGTERKDVKGIPFDVYYDGSAGNYKCTQGFPKCYSCSWMADFFATLP